MMNQIVKNQSSEFSRSVAIADLADGAERHFEIEANAAERAALAERCALLSLDELRAQAVVRRTITGDIEVQGHLQAKLVQECVVTLDPVADTIAAPFEQTFTLRPDSESGDLVIGPEDPEPPEVLSGESIDLGELVAQFLSLSINPYPRSSEADEMAGQLDDGDAQPPGPFAALAKLRRQDPE